VKGAGGAPEEWGELEGLVDQLLDAGHAERAALLDELSGGDADRRTELERLVADCERPLPLLERPVADQFDSLFEDSPTIVPERLAERYEIAREVGRGGMAVVYLAKDLRHDRAVAIKVVRGEHADAAGRRRFLREIAIAARLKHPHIVPVFDSGDAGSVLYYVMPFEEGDSLRARLIRDGPLPVQEGLRIVREVCDALAHAHQHGVIHRDIKPENVLLSGRHAMVTDFGIARALAATDADGNEQTTQGGVIGTRPYMAPEQASAAGIDHRVDIFALGVMAYEMFAGDRPFGGAGTPESAGALTRASEYLTRRRADLPPDVVAIVMKCLSTDPADRYQSADEMMAALDASSAIETSDGQRSRSIDTHGAEATRPVHDRPWVAPLSVGLVVAAAAVALVVATRPGATPPPAISRPLTLGILPVTLGSPDSRLRSIAAGIENYLAVELTPIAGLKLLLPETITPLADRGWSLDSIALRYGIDIFVETTLSEGERGALAVAFLLTEEGIAPVGSEPLPQLPRGTPNLAATLGNHLAERIRTLLGTRIRVRELEASTADTVALKRWRVAEQHRLRMRRHLGRGDVAGATAALDSAESEFLRSEATDRNWTTPRVARASLQEWRAFLRLSSSTNGPGRAHATFNAGIANLDSVIRSVPRHALALALRGRLRAERVRVDQMSGVDRVARLAALDSARHDLERSLEIDSLLPRPAADLSQLWFELGNYEAAARYAAQAYRVDRYLEDASTIVHMLAVSHLEIGEDAIAVRWCAEGMRRFPDDPMHYGSALEVMAWGNGRADVDSARRYLREMERIQGSDDHALPVFTAVYAGVLARAAGVPPATAKEALRNARLIAERLDADSSPHFQAVQAAVLFRLGERAAGDSLVNEVRRGDEDAELRFRRRALREYVQRAASR